MPRNGSGTMTADVDFTTEAASPPIEIAKLDQALDDMADELTNSIAADGQTNPSADLKMNGFKHTNVGAATALTHYGRVTEIIDQDYVYYVDSGSANTIAITPSPAIAAYEEGQRFVIRIAANNSGATTLNVNALGAFAVQTVDGAALASGALLQGGIYEFTYDANTTPDRWVLTSPSSKIPDGMFPATLPAASGVNLTALNGTNIASGTVAAARLPATTMYVNTAISGADGGDSADPGYQGVPPQAAKTADYTVLAADDGTSIRATSNCDEVTIQLSAGLPVGGVVMIIANRSGTVTVVQGTGATLYLAGTAFGTTGNRTIADGGVAYVYHYASGNYIVSGTGVS